MEVKYLRELADASTPVQIQDFEEEEDDAANGPQGLEPAEELGAGDQEEDPPAGDVPHHGPAHEAAEQSLDNLYPHKPG